jgi:hypothetical protein
MLLFAGVAGIAYADGEHVVVLECDEVQEDGTCNPAKTVVEVYSRSSQPLKEADIDKLAPVAERLCLDRSDFHIVPHDCKYSYAQCVACNCETMKYISRVSYVLVDCPVDHTPEFNCKVDEIPSAEDFEPDQVCVNFAMNVRV